MLKIHGLLFLLLPLATAGAQSQASVTDSRMITEKNGGKPDTVLTRTITSGGRSRTDVTGPGTLQEPWRTIGTIQITVASDSGEVVTSVDSAKKSYWSVNTRSLLASAQMKAMVHVQPAAAGTAPTLDSLGSGGVVAGYNTVHFRGHSTTRMTMDVLGQATPWNTVQTTDYYVAPGLHLDSLEKAAHPVAKRTAHPDSGMIPSGMKQLAAETRALRKRMDKLGDAVKTVTESTTTVGGGTQTLRQTTELLDHRTMSVPDSLFAIPAGYKKTLPGFNPTP